MCRAGGGERERAATDCSNEPIVTDRAAAAADISPKIDSLNGVINKRGLGLSPFPEVLSLSSLVRAGHKPRD